MTRKPSSSLPFILVLAVLLLPSCASDIDMSDNALALPDGFEVVALELLDDEEVFLSGSDERGFAVTVRLNAALPEGTAATIPFMVRDVEFIAGQPLAVSLISVAGGESENTVQDRFFMVCEDGDVAGRTATPGTAFGDLEDWDRSSGERSTRIFIQYGEETWEFLGITLGVRDAVESDRVRVTCEDE